MTGSVERPTRIHNSPMGQMHWGKMHLPVHVWPIFTGWIDGWMDGNFNMLCARKIWILAHLNPWPVLPKSHLCRVDAHSPSDCSPITMDYLRMFAAGIYAFHRPANMNYRFQGCWPTRRGWLAGWLADESFMCFSYSWLIFQIQFKAKIRKYRTRPNSVARRRRSVGEILLFQ